jgi:hypothetical protein
MEDRSRAAERCQERKAARAQLVALAERRQACQELERLAPLTRYYGPRPLRAVPLAQLLEQGWWAA